MTATPATSTWPSAAPTGTPTSRARFHVLGLLPHVLSGDATANRQADGSWTLELRVEGITERITVAAGETFDAGMQRLVASLLQASYPTDDPTSESSVAPLSGAEDAL